MLHVADAWQRLGRLGIVIALVGVGASSPLAQTITDGDTLKQGGVTYRLWGIDAPETKQTCPDGWPAGSLATTRLQALIAGRSIVCQEKDRDRYGRIVCRVSGKDLGAVMMRPFPEATERRHGPPSRPPAEPPSRASNGVPIVTKRPGESAREAPMWRDVIVQLRIELQ